MLDKVIIIVFNLLGVDHYQFIMNSKIILTQIIRNVWNVWRKPLVTGGVMYSQGGLENRRKCQITV